MRLHPSKTIAKADRLKAVGLDLARGTKVFIKIGRQTLSTFASTLVDLYFLSPNLCFLAAEVSRVRKNDIITGKV